MEIEYLTELINHSYINFSGQTVKNKPLPIEEIKTLEKQFNNVAIFPKALKELLFLAGGYCDGLDYGLCETQQELQNIVKEVLEDSNLKIERPFYVIDIYNGGDQFFFVYLDEGNNPKVYEAISEYQQLRIKQIGNSLSEFIAHLIALKKEERERR